MDRKIGGGIKMVTAKIARVYPIHVQTNPAPPVPIAAQLMDYGINMTS